MPWTQFDSNGVKLAPFSLANGVEDDVKVVMTQNENGTFVPVDPSAVMGWRSGSTDIPRDSDRLLINERVSMSLDASILVLCFSVMFVSSWVGSILIEQLIFYYISKKGWMVWWMLATVSLSMGIWSSLMVR